MDHVVVVYQVDTKELRETGGDRQRFGRELFRIARGDAVTALGWGPHSMRLVVAGWDSQAVCYKLPDFNERDSELPVDATKKLEDVLGTTWQATSASYSYYPSFKK